MRFSMRRRNIEKHDFVGARLAVRFRQFRGIAGIAQIHKLHALDDASVVHVEAGDNAFGQHVRARRNSSTIFKPTSPDFSG